MFSILINLLVVFLVIDAFLLILVVLMQRPKSEGLGAAFGGGMTENLFGAQTTNVLANITRWLGGIFFALTLLLSIIYARGTSGRKSAFSQEMLKQSAPAALASPAASPKAMASATASVAPSATAVPSATPVVPIAPAASPTPAQ